MINFARKLLTIQDLVATIRIGSRTARPLLVGIDGHGGSGKSTLARLLFEAVGNASLVHGDDFYRPSAERYSGPEDLRPVASDFDIARLVKQVLEPLRRGEATSYQRYSWHDDILGDTVALPVTDLTIIEGIYTTSHAARHLYDYRIWVECPPEERLQRGIARDGEQARARWVEDWMPQEDRYVALEAPQNQAHLVVSGAGADAELPEKSIVVLTQEV